jgi:glycosyltransferase involved in cell wall biosynthesis
MMHLFLNGLAASAGGGLTYLRNVIPHLAARTDVRTTVAANPCLRQELRNSSNISFLEMESPANAAQRFWHEQNVLPGLIRRMDADVVISAGNFALWRSPVPQMLLSRNALYTSRDFSRDLRGRGDYGMWLDTRIKGIIARRSVHWADCTVAPSRSFAEELRQWTGRDVVSIHHGFDPDAFFEDKAPLPEAIAKKLLSAQGALRLLFVSHYNYYRNFETLLRALPRLQGRLSGREVRLFLTCTLRSEDNPGSYRASAAADLVRQLGIGNHVVELGPVPYHLLHQVYRACDCYVTPAYAESFAHPLVEAMAAGLPVVASDLPVHREICCGAALYSPRFSHELLTDCILRLDESPFLRQQLSNAGLKRSRDFSWSTHVEQIVGLATELVKRSRGDAVAA